MTYVSTTIALAAPFLLSLLCSACQIFRMQHGIISAERACIISLPPEMTGDYSYGSSGGNSLSPKWLVRPSAFITDKAEQGQYSVDLISCPKEVSCDLESRKRQLVLNNAF